MMDVGELVWHKTHGKALILEKTSDGYKILIRAGRKKTRTAHAPEHYLMFYITHCPICGRHVRTLKGLVEKHTKEESVCYGSFLPLI